MDEAAKLIKNLATKTLLSGDPLSLRWVGSVSRP